jgi:peptidoglycan-associated lipoprotein
MKYKNPILLSIVSAVLFSSCTYTSDAWEGTKTASRFLQKKGLSLFGADQPSKMVEGSEDFFGPDQEEFIPLNSQDLQLQASESVSTQPIEDPGIDGSPVPGYDGFRSPSSKLASIFRNVYFNTDAHTLKQKEHFHTIRNVSQYLRRHPNTYIFVAGHCDDRASESYNLALGSRRSNFVRNLLIKEGVNPNQIYAISFGREQPIVRGFTRAARAKNRRVEFKLFDSHQRRKGGH